VDVELAGFASAHVMVTVLSDTAPVLHVQLQIATVTAGVTVSASPEHTYAASATPTTLVNRADIASTPGAGRTNGVEMITAFVPGSYVTHDQLHVRGGHQVSWLVDGVALPNTNIASNVGPQFDPKDADYVEVLRGGYRAEYGDRTYGVFNVVPRTGFERNNDAELVLSAGSFAQTNDQVSVGGPARLEGHTTVDLRVGKAFGDKLSVSLSALNVANQHLLIDNSQTFGGTHFNSPREVYAELRYRFHD
jgi:outer membrane cobalamin receptor